jgi:aminoglycoside 6'-N-acetyltransferase
MPRIEFRPLRSDDLPTLVEWFAQPTIARWWIPPLTAKAVEAKYQPRIDGHEPIRMWIIEFDGTPGGMIQSYRHVDFPSYDAEVALSDAVGIDYLLDDRHRGIGLGHRALRAFAVLVFDEYPDAERCVATPARDNEPSWRCLERAGFVRRGECQPADEPAAYTYSYDCTTGLR